MNEVTLAKCERCGHYYQADRKHKCKSSERFSYGQGRLDGYAQAFKEVNFMLECLGGSNKNE